MIKHKICFSFLFIICVVLGTTEAQAQQSEYYGGMYFSKSSARDFLRCIHFSGQYSSSRVLQKESENGVVKEALRIRWKGGFLGTSYETILIVYRRENTFKISIYDDSAFVPAFKGCGLYDWTSYGSLERVVRDSKRAQAMKAGKKGWELMNMD